jgi:Na+/H+ antiporter NhaC
MWHLLLCMIVLVIQQMEGFVIKEAYFPVVLQNIDFPCTFQLAYNKTDEQYDWIQVIVRADKNVLGILNQSVFTSDSMTRISEFQLDHLQLSTIGSLDLIMDVSLSYTNNNGTAISSEVQSQIIPSWTIPGPLTLLPLIVTITIAILTRNVLPALFFGVWAASFVIYQYNVHTSFARTLDNIIVTALTTVENQFVILFAMIMGGFVNMINESRGSIGLANGLSVIATTGRSTQFATLVFGVLIFFDDYASALILGATLRTIADKMSVSREKFCFLVDSGAAPIAALVPVTSWTAFETALLQTEADKLIAQGIPIQDLGYETSGFLGLLRMLKYAYYSIFLLCFQLVLIGTKREFGPMFLAERRALLYGVSDARYKVPSATGSVTQPTRENGSGNIQDKPDDKFDPLNEDGPPPRCINAAIPILFFVMFTVIAMVVLGAASVPQHETIGAHNIFASVNSIEIMYYGAVLASFLAAIMYRFQSMPAISKTDLPTSDGTRVLVRQSSMYSRCCGKRKRRPLMTFTKSVEAFVEGFTHLTSTIMILVLAWSIGIAGKLSSFVLI